MKVTRKEDIMDTNLGVTPGLTNLKKKIKLNQNNLTITIVKIISVN